MKVKIGDYLIKSDPYCYVLTKQKIRKEGKKKGEEYQDTLGYYGTLESCVEAIIEEGIRSSEATSLKMIVDEVNEIKQEIQEALKGI